MMDKVLLVIGEAGSNWDVAWEPKFNALHFAASQVCAACGVYLCTRACVSYSVVCCAFPQVKHNYTTAHKHTTIHNIYIQNMVNLVEMLQPFFNWSDRGAAGISPLQVAMWFESTEAIHAMVPSCGPILSCTCDLLLYDENLRELLPGYFRYHFKLPFNTTKIQDVYQVAMQCHDWTVGCNGFDESAVPECWWEEANREMRPWEGLDVLDSELPRQPLHFLFTILGSEFRVDGMDDES